MNGGWIGMISVDLIYCLPEFCLLCLMVHCVEEGVSVSACLSVIRIGIMLFRVWTYSLISVDDELFCLSRFLRFIRSESCRKNFGLYFFLCLCGMCFLLARLEMLMKCETM